MPQKISVIDSESRKKLSVVDTVPYAVYLPRIVRSREEIIKDLFPEENRRKDGRAFTDHRKVYLECGIVKDARGSAYVAYGETKVVASVSGPAEIQPGIEFEEQGYLNCEVKFSQFSCKSREEEEELTTQIDTITDAVNRAIEPSLIKEELSNVQVNLALVVVEDDGGVISAAVVAACLALASGRLPLRDLVSSAGLCLFHGSGNSPVTLIDPTDAEVTFAISSGPNVSPSGLVTLSYTASSERISDCVMLGRLDLPSIQNSVASLKEHCSQIYGKMQKVLTKNVKMVKDVILERNKIPNRHETTESIQESLRQLSS